MPFVFDDISKGLSYDPASQVTAISHQLTALGSQINKAEYGYNGVGNRESLTDRRGIQNFGYDTLDRLTSASHPLLGTAQSFAYDPVGNRTATGNVTNAGNQLTADATHSYQYDDNGNLTRKTLLATGNYSQYTYDAAGNRTSLTRNNGTASLLPSAVASATYDPANEQTSFAGTTLTYDANGNLTNDGTHTYISDSKNRLVGVNGPGLVATFAYDALNRRVLKTINGVAIGQLLDGKDVVAEIAGGSIASTYLRSLALDEPFIRTGSTGKEMYHADPLGSTLLLTDETGAVKTTYEYDPFGKTVPHGAISGNPFQYTGRENDGGGLYYYRARFYRPYEQRFTKEDPIGYGGGPNFYAYVENNPTRYTDPDGLLAGTVAGATVGAVAGPLGVAVGAVVGTVVQGVVVGGLIFAASVTPGDTLTSDAQRQAEYELARNFCNNQPPPGSNDCSTLSRLIDHAKKCIELYEAWDRRWSPGRHAEKIQGWRNRLNNLKDEHRKKCSNKCS